MPTYYVDGAVGSDSNPGTSAGAGNAWLTVGHALGAMAQGDLSYVKASATYSISATLTAGNGSGSVNYGTATRVVGYTSTPGDGGRATIRTTAAVAGLTVTGNGWAFENLVLDGNSTGTRGVDQSGDYGATFTNLLIQNWTGEGFYSGKNSAVLLDSEVTGCGGTSAVDVSHGSYCSNCRVHGNTGAGIYQAGGVVLNCRVYGNGGRGIDCQLYPPTILGCTVHGNTSDGIGVRSYYLIVAIRDNVLTSNGGYGINASAKSAAGVDLGVDYNWFGTGSLANTSGARSSNLSAGPHDASGDPGYASAGTGDFTPSNSAVQAGSP